ncbi:MAG: hypothetical protein CGW95_00325 [Phenylobacterium zucineum]|nr:MAG: hypothetical protein CGW95_00325 [Phenylobacterium zucineum]
MVLLLLAATVQECAGLHVALIDLAGHKTSLREDLNFGFRNALPMFGLMVLLTLAYLAGFLLLVVPGIMMALAFSVALPVALMERTGVFGAFRRSRDLTRNNRWRILGLFLIFSFANIAVSLIIRILGGGGLVISSPRGELAVAALSFIQSTVFTSAGFCIYAALYTELCRIKAGNGPAEVSTDTL